MPAQKPAREPGQVTISVEREEYSPGDTVSFSVTVAARDVLEARALVVDLFGVEEVEPFDDDEEDDFLFGLDDDEEDETTGENILTLSVNGEGMSEAEDDEDEDEDEDDWEDDEEDALASFTFEDEAVLATDLSFKANETRTFNGSFVIPEDAQPSYFGIRATHTWWLDAYLDADVNVASGKEILVR